MQLVFVSGEVLRLEIVHPAFIRCCIRDAGAYSTQVVVCVRVRARVLCVVRCIVLCILNYVNGPTLFCLIKYLYLARMGQVVTGFFMLFAYPAFTVIFFLQNFIFNHTTGAGYSGRAAKSRLFPHSSSCT